MPSLPVILNTGWEPRYWKYIDIQVALRREEQKAMKKPSRPLDTTSDWRCPHSALDVNNIPLADASLKRDT
jgi:hypothetical protein